MTASAPQLLKIVTFTLKATGDGGSAKSFAEDVLEAAIVPSPPAVLVVTTLDGVAHQDVGTETWSLDLSTVVDWDTTRPGLAQYLYTYRGQAAAFVLNAYGTAAESTTAPKMTGTCRLVPIQYGGPGNEYAEGTVSLPITGVPVLDSTP